MSQSDKKDLRQGIRVTGIVQGVGFRPLVSVLADRYELSGFVYNDAQGVYIEVQGPAMELAHFSRDLQEGVPQGGRIDFWKVKDLATVANETTFVIKASPNQKQGQVFLSADTAPCKDCLKELLDPHNRRYGYAFINCTHCGPRYTLIEATPYDRARTSMKVFPMCKPCQAEYDDIHSRRYHAEPNACPACGPRYSLYSPQQELLLDKEGEAFTEARRRIAKGQIVALKGIGGYHLICDARNEKAVQRLRKRKHRPDKPLALMVKSLELVRQIAQISPKEEALLQSPKRPIVLLPWKMDSAVKVAREAVAPQNHQVGLMLPYAPVHYVLLPEEAVWVMTSGNPSGFPVIYEDEEAFRELASIADVFLTHNRRIVSPVDDSVTALVEDKPYLYRRSRGYVPLSIGVPIKGKKTWPTLLAMGGDLKNAFAMNRDKQVLLGPHIGDLQNQAMNDMLRQSIRRYQNLFQLKPKKVLADAHPAYFSSQLGRELAKAWQVPCIEVQHHQAHAASVIAEYGLQGKVLGLVMDGTGYGPDGTIWGSEWLLCQDGDYERLAHLSYTPLPGGEEAVRQPWRQAAYYLQTIYGDTWPAPYVAWRNTLPKQANLLLQALAHGMKFPLACGAGRLFDAAGCLLGLGNVHSFDGQVAMALEELAYGSRGGIWPYTIEENELPVSALIKPLIVGRVKGLSRDFLAASFHQTLAHMLADKTVQLCQEKGIKQVALSGGVFQNRLLLESLVSLLRIKDLQVYIPHQAPVNDGGLALGQLYIGQMK